MITAALVPRPFIKQIDPMLVERGMTLRDVIGVIDRGGIGLALMLDASGRLTATITDGDVRRALLGGLAIDAAVDTIVKQKPWPARPTPATAPTTASDEELLEAFRKEEVSHLPLLDDAGRVVDIALLSKMIERVKPDIAAMVMAGGYGTRLRPLTDDKPKPMLPVGGQPLLERTILQLRSSGITEISISTHYFHDKISAHFGNGNEFGVKLNYVVEEQPLGTAGALGLLEPPQNTLLVMNGDIVTSVDYRMMVDYHRSHGADLTVAVGLYEVNVPYGVVVVEHERVAAIQEKPQLRFFTSAGIYLVEPDVWNYIPRGQKLDMPQLINALIENGKSVVSFPMWEYWLDIGRIDDYNKAQSDIREGKFAPVIMALTPATPG